MLKRLELVGFKSFADRTWFDFPAGLTAIVGPNGSGKSNVVDAVRWILGEQSAKSLRGGEMADVIFNGSTSRKGLGLAEVTLTFDNTSRKLNSDSAEVAITRRVYRDGTGEYLINGQITRLKDIRELFLGSGAGSTTYCIIEQGRVDALLQSSHQNRRAIFEEAAGISRFKAKKIETIRKLENTQENLTRLKDIYGEVEGRLRRVRLDAEKARRYQEHSTRLRELRVGTGLREYDVLTRKLTAETESLQSLRSELSGAQMQSAIWEEEAASLEQSLAAIEQEQSQSASQLAEARSRISTLHERFDNELARQVEAETELASAYRRGIDLGYLTRSLEQARQTAAKDLAEAEGEAAVRKDRVIELEAASAAIEAEVAVLRKRIQEGRDRQFQLVSKAASASTEAGNAKTQLDRFQRDRDRKNREIDTKTIELDGVERVLETLDHQGIDLQQRLGQTQQTLATYRAQRDDLSHEATRCSATLEELRVKRSGLNGRIEVLEELERSQEGLGTGVREALAELANKQSPLNQAVIGLVADALRVPREIAPLIDTALGEVSSHFVVRDSWLLSHALAQRELPFSGRVSFLPRSNPQQLPTRRDTADCFVSSDHPELAGLPRQLLGKTLIVDDLAIAQQLANDPENEGFRFVTKTGELLEANGTLTVSIHRAESGILSRKSELRDLHEQAAGLDAAIQEAEQLLATIRARIDSLAGPIHVLEEEIRALTVSASDLHNEIQRQTQQKSHLADDIALAGQELGLLEEEMARIEEHWRHSKSAAEEAERQEKEVVAEINGAELQIRHHELDRAGRVQIQTTAQIALAEINQRLVNLQETYQRLESDLSRGRGEVERLDRHAGIVRTRALESEMAALRSSAALADTFTQKEACERQLHESQLRKTQEVERRSKLVQSLQETRSESQQQYEAVHTKELSTQSLSTARLQITDRLREDYQLDLEVEYQASPLASGEPLPGEWDAPAAAKEIEDLKKKIRNLGNVSLEALQELTELETRANELHSQVTDLSEAANSLHAIISKINDDSQRLFAETFETVRGNFQELFRKLFGGGMADVVLENPNDLLETGIDIIARPPGKELRSISLMSGGEKTLTAVALLLSIFRSKPSPFCLLDEVDAALDEANTERLARTLRDFTDHSQFIIITHKKRTMAKADVLYGITMQESGVSKQVAVRFDDWPEEEERPAA